VKAVAPFGQAAMLGVVPGAWVTGISPAGLDSTPVEKLTDFTKHKEEFLKQNFFKLYIKTVRVRVYGRGLFCLSTPSSSLDPSYHCSLLLQTPVFYHIPPCTLRKKPTKYVYTLFYP